MVSLNLTLFVLLGLFLLFLWGAQRIAFRPILRIMDEREEQIDQSLKAANQDAATAEEVEGRYTSAISSVRRDATVRMAEARRDAIDERISRLAEHRRACDTDVAAFRDQVRAQVEAERPAFPGLARQLSEVMEKQMPTENNVR